MCKGLHQMTLCCWLNPPDMHVLQHGRRENAGLPYTKQIKENNGLEHLVKQEDQCRRGKCLGVYGLTGIDARQCVA